MALPPEKLEKKRAQWIERTVAALNVPAENAVSLLNIKRQQSIRINSLVADPTDTLQSIERIGVNVVRTPWMKDGYSIASGFETVRDSELAQNGRIYIQNAASWLPVIALDPREGERVLDVCAAPGGKTSHIAQHANNTISITANDNSRPRLLKLQRNLERLQVHNVEYTLHDATKLARILPHESYDKILLDAPCSGEGMMTLDTKKDFESWSVAHIKRLQQLQKKIITQAWQLLKPGGVLVYSTCTMAPEENEAVVDYLLRRNDDAVIESLDSLGEHLPNRVSPVLAWNDKTYNPELRSALRLKPDPQIEAFFVVKLRKEVA